jgi:protocatechuate 3,4-dioxygenase beta subunit
MKTVPLVAVALAAWLARPGSAQTVAMPAVPPPTGTLNVSGTVTDPSGAPAAGVAVSILPTLGTAPAVHTDDQGRYSLDWQPVQMNVGGGRTVQANVGPGITYSVMARDQNRNLVANATIDASTARKDLQLQTGLTLVGNVEDDTGKPVTTALVQLTVITGNLGVPFNRQPSPVDADGAFSFSALPRGMHYAMLIRADGYGSANSQLSVAETDTDRLKLPAFTLRPASLPLAGQVLGSDDKPVPGAQVQVNGAGQPATSTRTDSRGHFELKVCEGQVQVIAFAPNGQNQSVAVVQAQSGDTKVVIRLGANSVTTAANGLRLVSAGGSMTLRGGRLKPPFISWEYFKWWPAEHKTVVCSIAACQLLVLAAVGGGIFWVVRRGRA